MSEPRELGFSVVGGGAVPAVESDFHIPLKVVWVAPESRPVPAYVRVSGRAGAELEVRVDPPSGAVLALVVLQLGGAGGAPVSAEALEATQLGCAVVAEPHVWAHERSGVAFVELPIRAHRLADGVQLEVEGSKRARALHSGPLTIALDADGSLAFLNAHAQIAERHFQS